MKKKLLFIYNAKSGTAAITKQLSSIIDIFIKHGYFVDVYQTQSARDAKRQIAKRANEFDMVVCSGGDGTLNEVASGLMRLPKENRPVVGYIPSGSTNDFAGSIGLKKDMMENAKIAVMGTPYQVDIGSFNKKNFVYIAAFGIFTRVSYTTPQKLKNLFGHQAYIMEGIKSISTIKSYRMRFEYEDKVIEDDFIYGMISNSNSAGGFSGIMGHDVVLDDGLYEVTLVRTPKNLIELLDIVNALVNQKTSEFIYSFKVSEIRVFSKKKIAWTLDGEYGGSHKEVYIYNNKNAMTILGDMHKHEHSTEKHLTDKTEAKND